MRTKGKTLILTVVLSGAVNAYAENADQVSLTPPTMQYLPNHATPRIDYFSAGFLAATRKSTTQESTIRDPSIVDRNLDVMPNDSTAKGVHWVPAVQHPGLELRFSNQGTIHLQPTRHGGSISAKWSF